jgi:ferritin-like metal-binding protein YciE
MAATSEKTLEDLFLHQLKDLYFAEKQIVKTLPKLAKKTTSEDLRKAFQKHLQETNGHVTRLEQVFELLGKPAQAVPCEAIKGILEEGAEIMEKFDGTEALDAGLAAAAQAVEHYEIARYGTLKCWAKEIGFSEIAGILDQTLQEEKKTDALLTQIAESSVNMESRAA